VIGTILTEKKVRQSCLTHLTVFDDRSALAVDEHRSLAGEGVGSIGRHDHVDVTAVCQLLPVTVATVPLDGQGVLLLLLPHAMAREIIEAHAEVGRQPISLVGEGDAVGERVWPGVEAIDPQLAADDRDAVGTGVARVAWIDIGCGDCVTDAAWDAYRIGHERPWLCSCYLVQTVGVASDGHGIGQRSRAGH